MQHQKEADKTVFVGNLGISVNEEILFELFLQAGPLKRVTIARDRDGRQRSYGFVYYKHAEAVPYAIALLNGTWLYGRQIKLQYSSGSSHQDGGTRPQGTDDRDGSSHNMSSVMKGLPEASVFHFSGRPDVNIPCQEQFHWNNKVLGYPMEQYPLSITPPQPLYYTPPTPMCPSAPPLTWPMPGYPQCALPQAPCPSQGQHLLPSSSPQSQRQQTAAHQGEGESGKPRKHRKSRESKHRLQKHRGRCKN